MTKEVYNPKERAEAGKPKKEKKPVAADEPLHAEEAKAETEFKAKLNKYGFIHVPKNVLSSLPFKAEEPLIGRIDGDALILRKA